MFKGHCGPATRPAAQGDPVEYHSAQLPGADHSDDPLGHERQDWQADEQLLHCPCHYTKFDPKDGARVVDGPAPRPLPALPLQIVDGKLAVASPFTTRVGFEPA